MTFELANASATYQRLQELWLGDLHYKTCFISIDDVIIFSKTHKEHVNRLIQVSQETFFFYL